MNANEIADELEKYTINDGVDDLNKKTIAMLRQLQAENEKLKNEVAEWKMSYENCHRMCNGYGMN